MPDVVRMTYEEWMAKGQALFGGDFLNWKFVCPICKGIQSVSDFKGLTNNPCNAYFNCLGRYQPEREKSFGGKSTPETRCDYTLGGLFRLPAVIVLHEGKEICAFAFAEVPA